MASLKDLIDLIRELRIAPSDVKVSKKLYRHVAKRAEQFAQEAEDDEEEEEEE